VFFLEEASAKTLLQGILPRLFGEESDISVRFMVFEGKQDLEKRITKRLAGYLNPDAVFLVIRDQDQGDCRNVKKELMKACQAGLGSSRPFKIA
jgi:hypothetical protein